MKIASTGRSCQTKGFIHGDSGFRSRYYAVIIICIITYLLTGLVSAQENNEWPVFHGSNRDNKSTETGLLKAWQESGPGHVWTVSGLGEGYSSVTIADGMLFTSGKKNDQSYVFAFDLNGKLIWEMPNGKTYSTNLSWAKAYTGSRGTPTYNDSVVYQLGETGRLAAFDHKTGKELWVVDLCDEFDADVPMYGYSESAVIDGDRLYINPAGKKAYMVCLNKKDGTLIWANKNIPGVPSYTSAILTDFGGIRQAINLSSSYVYGVEAKTGKLLWSTQFEGFRSLNSTDAIYHDGHVFVSSGYGKGCMLVKLNSTDGRIVPETVWENELMDNHHGGVVLHDGYLYGAGHEARGWFCLDFMTGREIWKARGKGSLTYADGMLYLLEEKGDVRLISATHEKHEETGSFEVPEGGKGMYWAHPVVCGGRLYIRHTDKLFAYDVKVN